MSEREAYWKANIRLVGGCLAVWFIVSFGLGIILVEPLNNISLGGISWDSGSHSKVQCIHLCF